MEGAKYKEYRIQTTTLDQQFSVQRFPVVDGWWADPARQRPNWVVRPPSTVMQAPVTNDAASEARKSTT